MTPESVRASYKKMLAKVGEPIRIRRYTGSGASRPRWDVEVMARVTGYEERELVGSILQGDRRVIVLAQDLLEQQLLLPVTTNDKVVIRGKELAILASDDSTRRVGTVLIALELQVRG